MKPGLFTSEFALAVVVVVAATVLLIAGKITSTEWTAITGASSSVYGILRTVLKTYVHVDIPVEATPVSK